jgi:outer membrane protein TolC
MRQRILWFTALGLTVFGSAAAQQADTTVAEVSLGEAVRRALEVQPAMVQARGDLRNASAGLRSAYGAFLPNVTINGAATRGNTGRIDGSTGRPIPPEYSFTAGYGANLVLFAGLDRVFDRAAAASNRDAADAGTVDQRFQVTLQTKQLFYDALARQELLRVAEAQTRRTQQQLQISVDKLRAGSATRSDSLRGVVEHGNARIALLEAQASLATAEANLGRQIGLDRPVRALRDSALPALPDTGGLRVEALSRAPAVERASAQARAASAQLKAARSQYLPTVSVSFSDNYQGSDTPLERLWTWRFGLSWTVFNGFNREQQQVSASAQRDLAEARAIDVRRQVNAQLTQQLAALVTAHAQIDISRANVTAATEDLRVQQERYRVGAGTILELLTSQENLTQAEVSLVQTLFNYVLARAQLEALVGRAL